MERERVYLIGGPAGAKTLEPAPGSSHVKVLLCIREHQSWAIVGRYPRGGVTREVVCTGQYARTDWTFEGVSSRQTTGGRTAVRPRE